MQIIKKEVPSTDGIHTLRGCLYRPDGEIKGVLQITHGMTEHIARYDDFMKAVAEQGFAVCGHDHLGHGKTAENESELGYFAPKNGWQIVADDIHTFGKEIMREFPDKPHILLGHSMGSFLARQVITMHPDAFDALIIMGTGGPNPLSSIGLMLTSIIGKIKGEKHISGLTQSLAFGSYNKRTGSTDPNAWLTHDKEHLARYASDPFCTFPFTVSAMHDLISVQNAVNKKSWFESVKKTMPILIVSGEEDPVGNYGKGVEEVYRRLLSAGVTNVKRTLYKGMRHEILNEIEYKTVYQDLISFLNLQI